MHFHWRAGAAAVLGTAIAMGNIAAGAEPLPSTSSRANLPAVRMATASSDFTVTPLLTGGMLVSERSVTLNQAVAGREDNPDGCAPWYTGKLALQEDSRASGLVDLGYEGVPLANPQPAYAPLMYGDSQINGSLSVDAGDYGCDGDQQVKTIEGKCTDPITDTGAAGIFEPVEGDLQGVDYEPGVSKVVTATVWSDAGMGCSLSGGQIKPWPIGVLFPEYTADTLYESAFLRPPKPLQQDSVERKLDLAKSDSNCFEGTDIKAGDHVAGFYGWTQRRRGEEPPDYRTATCSSKRTGYVKTTMQRALIIKDVVLYQATPKGDERRMLASDPIIDGNQVRMEFLVENRWKREISTDLRLYDVEYDRSLPMDDKGANPRKITVGSGQQMKVSILWRTDGIAWETAGKPISKRQIGIVTPFGGAQINVVVRPRPVLLVHGWRSSAGTWSNWPGFVKSIRPDWDVDAARTLNTEPEVGYTVQMNAFKLAGEISKFRNDTGAVHLDLVAHSMGGMISRYYLSRLMAAPPKDGRPVVRSLTMYGTPNLGSDCAYVYLATFERSWSEKGYIPSHQLTPPAAEAINAVAKPVSGVRYQYLAGVPLDYLSCAFVAGNDVQQPNDFVVTITSAQGRGLGGTPLAPPDDTLHFNMTGSRTYFDITLAKVLGLGADKATASAFVAPTSAAQPGATRQAVNRVGVAGSWAAHAEGKMAGTGSLKLRSPGGENLVCVTAPAGVRIDAVGPGGVKLKGGEPGGMVSCLSGRTSAGTVNVTVTGSSDTQGSIGAALGIVGDSRTVTASAQRRASNIVITAQSAFASKVTALVKVGDKPKRTITLRKQGSTWTGSVPGGSADDLVRIVVTATAGGQVRDTIVAL